MSHTDYEVKLEVKIESKVLRDVFLTSLKKVPNRKIQRDGKEFIDSMDNTVRIPKNYFNRVKVGINTTMTEIAVQMLKKDKVTLINWEIDDAYIKYIGEEATIYLKVKGLYSAD